MCFMAKFAVMIAAPSEHLQFVIDATTMVAPGNCLTHKYQLKATFIIGSANGKCIGTQFLSVGLAQLLILNPKINQFMFLSQLTQIRLCELIVAIAQAEKHTELLRQVLAEQTMFQPYSAFKRLDQLRVGELSVQDINEYLNDHSITPTPEEAQYLFKRLDSNRDQTIHYQDFLHAILPKEDGRLRQIASLRQTYDIPVGMLLPAEVEWALAKLFKQEIQNYSVILKYLKNLTSSSDFNSLDAFRTVDTNYLGYITIESINSFIQRNHQSMSSDQINAFFRVVDIDQDGRITYAELLEAITLVPNYFNSSGQHQGLRKSRELLEAEKVQQDLKRSREQIIDNLRREEEYIWASDLKRSREYVSVVQEARKLTDYLTNEQNNSREKLDSLTRNRQQRSELELSRERLQNMRSSRSRSRELQEQQGTRKQQVIYDLKQSRENGNELMQSGEVLRRSRERNSYLRRSREFLENLRRSRERLQEFNSQQPSQDRQDLRRQTEEARRSNKFPYLDALKRSQEREHLNQITHSDRQLIAQSNDMKRSREKLEELKKSREVLQRLEQDRFQYYQTQKLTNIDSEARYSAKGRLYNVSKRPFEYT